MLLENLVQILLKRIPGGKSIRLIYEIDQRELDRNPHRGKDQLPYDGTMGIEVLDS